MRTNVAPSPEPVVYSHEELADQFSALHVNTGAVAVMLGAMGHTPDEIASTRIGFSNRIAEQELNGEYIPASNSVLLYPRTERMPVVSGVYLPHSARGREERTDARDYCRQRSQELSGSLALLLVQRAVDSGYRSKEMRDISLNRQLDRAAIHAGALLAGAAALYGYDKTGGAETNFGFFFGLFGMAAVLGMIDYAWADESRYREKKEIGRSMEDLAEANGTPSPMLVRLTPAYPRLRSKRREPRITSRHIFDHVGREYIGKHRRVELNGYPVKKFISESSDGINPPLALKSASQL